MPVRTFADLNAGHLVIQFLQIKMLTEDSLVFIQSLRQISSDHTKIVQVALFFFRECFRIDLFFFKFLVRNMKQSCN